MTSLLKHAPHSDTNFPSVEKKLSQLSQTMQLQCPLQPWTIVAIFFLPIIIERGHLDTLSVLHSSILTCLTDPSGSILYRTSNSAFQWEFAHPLSLDRS